MTPVTLTDVFSETKGPLRRRVILEIWQPTKNIIILHPNNTNRTDYVILNNNITLHYRIDTQVITTVYRILQLYKHNV